MALLAEYALTPDVFDATSYSSDEVCGLHLQGLKEVLLQEGLVRDLRESAWIRLFLETGRPWHMRGKELLKKLGTQKRLVPAEPARAQAPTNDSEWCDEALASHGKQPLTGIVATDATAAPHKGTPLVSSVSKLTSAAWWTSRSSSLRLARTLAAYEAALELVLRYANSLMFIDPHIDPTDTHQYGDLLRMLEKLQQRSAKPLVEVLHTDARYVCDPFLKRWIDKWQTNGWRTSSRKAVENQDLWQDLLRAKGIHAVTWRWVRGHADVIENNRCDELAVAARERLRDHLGAQGDRR
jgi:hypothetical protein